MLDESVDFDEFLRPVCLPPPDVELPPKKRCTVIGWGKNVHAEDADYMAVINEVGLG